MNEEKNLNIKYNRNIAYSERVTHLKFWRR